MVAYRRFIGGDVVKTKVIQITVAAQSGILLALCEDGSIWQKLSDQWEQVLGPFEVEIP